MEKGVKTTTYICHCKNYKKLSTQKQLNFEKILQGIQSDKLYGFLFVDIYTPEHLKKKYSDFPMMIKKVMVSRDDLSPYMKEVSEKNGYLKKTQKMKKINLFHTLLFPTATKKISTKQ